MNPLIYLASKSARRGELLAHVGVRHAVVELSEGRFADVDETVLAGESAVDYVTRLARTKAVAGWLKVQQLHLPSLPVLAADTTVVLGGAILGKPTDALEATRMLRGLSGKIHQVHTAVAIKMEAQVELTMASSEVRFREIEQQEIERYVRSGEPMDKAGAYGIQGQAAAFVEHLSGSHSGVVGLPLFETLALLKKFRVNIP